MKSYTIRRVSTDTNQTLDIQTRKQLPAAEQAFLNMVYDAIEAESLLDRPAGKTAVAQAEAIISRRNRFGSICVGGQQIIFAGDNF